MFDETDLLFTVKQLNINRVLILKKVKPGLTGLAYFQKANMYKIRDSLIFLCGNIKYFRHCSASSRVLPLGVSIIIINTGTVQSKT